jgi:hypothetical protein
LLFEFSQTVHLRLYDDGVEVAHHIGHNARVRISAESFLEQFGKLRRLPRFCSEYFTNDEHGRISSFESSFYHQEFIVSQAISFSKLPQGFDVDLRFSIYEGIVNL